MSRSRRGRGEGSAIPLANGLWRARTSYIDANGERQQPSATFDTKKQALAWLAQFKHDQANGVLAEAGVMTISDWLDRWLADKKGQVEPNTWTQYEQHVRLHLKPRMGKSRLSKLRPLHVRDLYASMETAGDSAAMRKKAGVTLPSALKDAVTLQLLASNPAAAVPKPKAEPPEIRPLTAEQLRAFVEAAQKERLCALFVLAVDSSMRQGELFGLLWEDVKWDAQSVVVCRSLEEKNGIHRLKAPKNKASRRTIKLRPATMAALSAHHEQMTREGFARATTPVFCDTKGGWLRKSNFTDGPFTRVLKGAELGKVRFHDLRHSGASLLLQSGVSIKAVSARLGHSSVSTTLNIYAHVLPDSDDQAVRALERALG